MDCSGRGCHGGNADDAFPWIMDNGGITIDADYPYTGKDHGTCNAAKRKHHWAQIGGYRKVEPNNETKLMEAVRRQPIMVGFNYPGILHQYKSGVFSGPCRDILGPHAVALVGYGKDAKTGKKYWIAKGSYGPKWGMKGYLLMERDVANPKGLCGIAEWPYYPCYPCRD
ncbi:hypothetical protein PR202_gb14034 [Eleusine coracana subsp. coracana]|uniref:Peptidase C1A papain C-terminal domain-containing protein n=1 Tax=Eleusine coracana subsp. coracana TaxID=191504 RepID=A0AAV5EV88_ELECO|nr:hypothetical protein PR202_gb14034 [Eleusine coracana subsp. coracana]